MQLQYAGDNLRPVPAEHLLARKAADLPGVKKMVTEDPAGVVRLILEHSDQPARPPPRRSPPCSSPTCSRARTEFKRWWEAAKKKLKGDGRFVVPAKKTEFVEMREADRRPDTSASRPVPQARTLKDQLAVARPDFQEHRGFQGRPRPADSRSGAQLASRPSRNQRLDVDASFELLVTRDEIAGAAGLPASVTERPRSSTSCATRKSRLGEIIGNLPAAKQRFALHQMPAALGEDRWVTRALSLLPQTHNARVVGEVARLFEAQGRTRGDAHVPGPFDPRLFRHLRDAALAVQGARRREVQRFRQPAAFHGDPVGPRARRVQRDQAQHQAARPALQRPRTHHRTARRRRRRRNCAPPPARCWPRPPWRNSTNVRSWRGSSSCTPTCTRCSPAAARKSRPR